MPSAYISEALRQKVAETAKHRCGYCLTAQEFTAMPMHIEHIMPIAAGGQSEEANLWLACPLCNGSKAAKTNGVDPDTGEVVCYSTRDFKVGMSILNGTWMARR